MIRSKASLICLHITAWLLFMTVPLLFMSQGRPMSDVSRTVVLPYLQFCVLYITLFYLHTQVLIPRFFLQKKHALYLGSLLLLLTVIYFIKPFYQLVSNNRPKELFIDRASMPPPPLIHFDITSIFIFVMIVGLGAAMQATKQSQLFEKRAILAEAEKAKADLLFLRAQVNPHFLYNTLNNVYTLCVIGSEHAAESIMKLSNIMRYVTDGSEADFVPLKEELDCLDNFIDLQQLRLGKKVTLNYAVTGDASQHLISPLILTTFVENAFKYGLSNHHEATIDISIKVETQKIIFSAKNKIFDRKEGKKRKGIGIENTKKRLEHLYPNAYSLQIGTTDGFFDVLLVMSSKSYL